MFLEPFLKPGVFLLFNCLIAMLILILSFFLSEAKPYVEKISAYECGFEPDEDARNIFDVRFYIVAMLFLVFDLEAIFFFPWCVSLSSLDTIGLLGMLDFLVELLIGYIYALQVGALNWV